MTRNILLAALLSGFSLFSLCAMDSGGEELPSTIYMNEGAAAAYLVKAVDHPNLNYNYFERSFARSLLRILNKKDAFDFDRDCITLREPNQWFSIHSLLDAQKLNLVSRIDNVSASNLKLFDLRTERILRVKQIIQAYESGDEKTLRAFAVISK